MRRSQDFLHNVVAFSKNLNFENNEKLVIWGQIWYKIPKKSIMIYRCPIRLLTWNSIIMLLHSNAHAICHRWFNEALQKLTLLPKNLGICSSMDLMSFHADQSLSLFIYFLGKVFIIQFLSYINHTLLFLRNPIGKLTIVNDKA